MKIINTTTGHSLQTDHLPGQKRPVLIFEAAGTEIVLARFKSQKEREIFDDWLGATAGLTAFRPVYQD